VASDRPEHKITLPRITRVALENFDLYSRQPNAEIQIEKGVVCLIGANGLGKSTFLNTLNFGITGAIPDPDRKFQSAKDYYTNAIRIDRAEDYFTGRITEASRPLARVTVELTWPSVAVKVTRDIFNGSEISNLLINGEDISAGVDSSLANLGAAYEKTVLAHSGLEDFAQFVFLFHFVCTFDEGRHLLTWDHSALTNALYLSFGADPADARTADKLQNEMDKESSRGRNVRFSARHLTERIRQLMEILAEKDSGDFVSLEQLRAKHDVLLAEQAHAEERVRTKQNELRDADLRWTDLSASLTKLQMEYKRAFSERIQHRSMVEHHPMVQASISDDACAICGTTGIAGNLKGKLANHFCPLCDTPVEPASIGDNSIVALRKLDTDIIRVRDELSSVLNARERISAEMLAAEATAKAAYQALLEFENGNAKALNRIGAGESFSGIRKEIDKLEAEREKFLEQSQIHYKKRDKIREKLRLYEKELKKQYDLGAEQFVPRFRELAEEFIGFEIDIQLDHRQGANDSGFGLKLSMNDQLRLSPDKLSESQRFFIDIALRMALTEFLSDTPATLLIDTPEGSLDIAYEARAGAMFSKFVAEGNVVLMTANLRSSQLVLRLAELQRKQNMQIVRMTDWTELSEVQQSEETLFMQAYQKIEQVLL